MKKKVEAIGWFALSLLTPAGIVLAMLYPKWAAVVGLAAIGILCLGLASWWAFILIWAPIATGIEKWKDSR